MKVSEVLGQVNRIKPNALDDETLLIYLNRIEAMVQTEALKRSVDEVETYKLPEDADREVILPTPYDQVYEMYIEAMIDLVHQDYGEYNNEMVIFNQAWNEMLSYYVHRERGNLRIHAYL